MSTQRQTGTVRWYSPTKGYGFIARERGGDVFVHYSAVRSQPKRLLEKGQRVEFTPAQSKKGAQAMDVIVLA